MFFNVNGKRPNTSLDYKKKKKVVIVTTTTTTTTTQLGTHDIHIVLKP
jgi:hypothetical protein